VAVELDKTNVKLTPSPFELVNRVRDRARAAAKTIVLPEAFDPRVLLAADAATADGLAKIILVGNSDTLHRTAAEHGADIDKALIVDPENSGVLDWFASQYYERRKHKGITEAQAQMAVREPLFFGAMMVGTGMADGMVGGSMSPTAKLIQAALHCVGPRPGLKTVSSFFLMATPLKEFGVNGALIYADAGVVPDPTPEQMADITAAAADHCRLLLEAEPLVALLSFSTMGSAEHPLVTKVRQALEIIRAKYPTMKVDGEMQLDAAIVPEVAGMKAPKSSVAGHANTLIFPDLNAGNIGYKLTERLARAKAVGPVLQGLAAPINDLSRGCKWEEIFDAIAITAIQATLGGNAKKQ
jgi:phosphate acetyltransferase